MYSPKKANRFMLALLLYPLLGTILLALPLGILQFLGYNLDSYNIDFIAILLYTQHLILFAVPFIFYLIFTKSKISDVLALKPISLKNIFLVTVLSILIQSFASTISTITSFFVSNDVGEEVVMFIETYPFALIFWAIAILPAILEEVIFRGIIFNNYKVLSFPKAIIFSSLFFAFIHLNLHQFFYTFALGIFLALLVRHTGSIYSSILSHFVINGSQIIVAKLALMLNPTEEALTQTPSIDDKLMALVATSLISLCVLPIFILVYQYFKRCNVENRLDYKDNVADNSSDNISSDISSDNLCTVSEHSLKPKYKIFTPSFFFILIIYAIYIVLKIYESQIT